MLEPGDLAPDFNAASHTGQPIHLADYRGKNVVVLYFYPMDGTPICTKQACGFRDAHEELAKLGAVVIGVSGSSLQRHRAFAAGQSLPFLLLSDHDDSLRTAYRVPNALGMVPRRVTYVIDKQGVIRYAFSALWSAEPHVTGALRIVRELAGGRDQAAEQP